MWIHTNYLIFKTITKILSNGKGKMAEFDGKKCIMCGGESFRLVNDEWMNF